MAGFIFYFLFLFFAKWINQLTNHIQAHVEVWMRISPTGSDIWILGPHWWYCLGMFRRYGLAGGRVLLGTGWRFKSHTLFPLTLCFLLRFKMWALSFLLWSCCFCSAITDSDPVYELSCSGCVITPPDVTKTHCILQPWIQFGFIETALYVHRDLPNYDIIISIPNMTSVSIKNNQNFTWTRPLCFWVWMEEVRLSQWQRTGFYRQEMLRTAPRQTTKYSNYLTKSTPNDDDTGHFYVLIIEKTKEKYVYCVPTLVLSSILARRKKFQHGGVWSLESKTKHSQNLHACWPLPFP